MLAFLFHQAFGIIFHQGFVGRLAVWRFVDGHQGHAWRPLPRWLVGVAHDHAPSGLLRYPVSFQRLMLVVEAVAAFRSVVSPVAVVIPKPAGTARVIAHLGRKGDGREGTGVCGGALIAMLDRSRMAIDPRIPATPGRSTPGVHRAGQTFLAPSATRREALGTGGRGKDEPIFTGEFVIDMSEAYF